MPANSKYEVKITGMYNGDIWQNVLHYMLTEGGTSERTTDAGKVADVVESQFIPTLAAAQSNQSVFMTLRVVEVGVEDPIIVRRGLLTTGQVESDPLPASDAVLFQKSCNVGGRRNYGKLYLACVPEAWATGSIVDITQAELTALGIKLKDSIVLAGYTIRPIIWHRSDSTAEFVTNYGIRAQISRQNRRHIPVL
jgi:hypothetical protein